MLRKWLTVCLLVGMAIGVGYSLLPATPSYMTSVGYVCGWDYHEATKELAITMWPDAARVPHPDVPSSYRRRAAGFRAGSTIYLYGVIEEGRSWMATDTVPGPPIAHLSDVPRGRYHLVDWPSETPVTDIDLTQIANDRQEVGCRQRLFEYGPPPQ